MDVDKKKVMSSHCVRLLQTCVYKYRVELYIKYKMVNKRNLMKLNYQRNYIRLYSDFYSRHSCRN